MSEGQQGQLASRALAVSDSNFPDIPELEVSKSVIEVFPDFCLIHNSLILLEQEYVLEIRSYLACSILKSQFLSSPLAGKRDIVVTIFVRCMCVHASVRPSRFVRTITCTFMHGFQSNSAQLLSLRSRSAV